MLNLPSSVRIYLFTAPTDMRRGVDGLASLVVASGLDIYSGHLFVFVSRRADRAKILTWSRGGFVLWYKRLERGRFRRPIVAAGQARTTIEPDQLILLLEGVDLRTVRRAPRWHPNKGIDSAPTCASARCAQSPLPPSLRSVGLPSSMAMPDDIAALVSELDPAASAVIEVVWRTHESVVEQLDKLQSEVVRLTTALAERDADLERYRTQLAERDEQLAERDGQLDKFKSMLFGSRSEKLPPIGSEVRRAVDEDELQLPELPPDASEQEANQARSTARRKRGRKKSGPARQKRRKALNKLPVVHEHITVSPEDLPAGMTRDDFAPLGDGETVRRVEHVREHLVVVEYHLEKLTERGGDRIVQAGAPPNVVDGGLWGPSVYAHVVVSKCVDSMPLFRIERALGRAGYAPARSVLCALFHRAAEVLAPVYDRLIHLVSHSPYVHADETRLPVMDTGKTRDAWIWTVLSNQIIGYLYSETRGGDTATNLLAGTTGTLLADGYSGYNGSVGADGRTRAGCWAHLRRKFYEALKTAPEAREMLDMIVELYRVEHEAARLQILGTDAHLALRDDRSATLVTEINSWVKARIDSTRPKSPLGKALTYADNQKAELSVFLTDANVPLDNNIAERALRIVAVGRKNFMFVGHDDAGHNLAVLQTVCSTCLLHGINPYEYLRDVLVRTRSHPASRLDELLPMNWKPPPGVDASIDTS